MVALYQKNDTASLGPLSSDLLEFRVPVILLEILFHVLATERDEGGWGTNDYPEITSYAILTLVSLSSLPLTRYASKEIDSAIARGRAHLDQSSERRSEPQYIWIEKVTYGSSGLSEAYLIAAMLARGSLYNWSTTHLAFIESLERNAAKQSVFFRRLPAFQRIPQWHLHLTLLEGLLFSPALEFTTGQILSPQRGKKDEYLGIVPSTWLAINHQRQLSLEPRLLWDMMVLKICNFRVDEHMETDSSGPDQSYLTTLESVIASVCSTNSKLQNGATPMASSSIACGLSAGGKETNLNTDTASSEVDKTGALPRYTRAMTNYPSIQNASHSDKSAFHLQLQRFLVSHLRQTKDNARFTQQKLREHEDEIATFHEAGLTFHEWVSEVGARSVSALMSFTFLVCLLGASSAYPYEADCFETAYLKYLAGDLALHVANMSRLHNDWGSLDRDLREANVNSINFPEFSKGICKHGRKAKRATSKGKDGAKAELLLLAEHERTQVDILMTKLEQALRQDGSTTGAKVADGVTLFVDVAKLYADMYCTYSKVVDATPRATQIFRF